MNAKLLGLCAYFIGTHLGLFSSHSICMAAGSAETTGPTPITILHTNDLHSHFRPDRSELQLGGIGRIKTTVDRLRQQNPNTLLVDGGDWSEGSIYYTLGTGTETLALMDHVGYDVAVVGNHDFLNGPDVLTEVIAKAGPKMSLIATNIGLEQYKNAENLRKWVLPYVIKEVGGRKIAFIGLTTYELIYDRFFSPVQITEPFFATQALASRLKKEVDAVVVLSHNSIFTNRWVLRAAPAVDLVIGAHDHIKIDKPIEVTRWGAKPGWIVETGCWGQYLGKVELEISPNKNVSLKSYNLIQMDFTVPEDPKTLARIEKLETRLEDKYGPVFSTPIGQNHLELIHSGEENLIANLVTDAYVQVTGADFAMESNTAIYGDLYPGAMRLVDIFNVYPAIFSPQTDKTWTLKKVPLKGSTLQKLLNIIYVSNKLRAMGSLSVSGISYTIDPILLSALNLINAEHQSMEPAYSMSSVQVPFSLMALNQPLELGEIQQTMAFPIVKDIRIRGIPLDPNQTYLLATGGMLVAGFELINSVVPMVPLTGMIDTGIEVWRAIGSYIEKQSPIDSRSVKVGGRITPQGPELGIYETDITWQPIARVVPLPEDPKREGMRGRLRIRIANYGKSSSSAGTLSRGTPKGPQLKILTNKNGFDESAPQYQSLTEDSALPAIGSGEDWIYENEIIVPAAKNSVGRADYFPVTIVLDDGRGNLGPMNKQVLKLFKGGP